MRKLGLYEGNGERLPPFTTELALMAIAWEVQRDACGQLTCEAIGIGAMRRKLGPLTPRHTVKYGTETARDEARMVLAGMCATCPYTECPMMSWGIKTPSG